MKDSFLIRNLCMAFLLFISFSKVELGLQGNSSSLLHEHKAHPSKVVTPRRYQTTSTGSIYFLIYIYKKIKMK